MSNPHPPGSYPVVVVGTGPGGLQLSYDLRRRGVEHALVSSDEGPAGMFRHFPLFQRLNTASRRYASVPQGSPAYYRTDWNSLVTDVPEHRALLAEFMDGESYFPLRSEIQAAYTAFAERGGVEARYGCTWESTRREGDELVLGTSDGEYRCRFAVFAVGMAAPWRPDNMPGVELVHHYDDLRGCKPEQFLGKRIFVIGKRNSAFEIAEALLPWAAQVICGSPHHVHPSINTAFPTAPRARYLNALEDSLFGGGTHAVDCAIAGIERRGDGWRVHAEGTTVPGTMTFDVDEVIATTGFTVPLGDLRDLGVETFHKDRLPAQTPFWESATAPGIFFAGAATQGQVGMRKYGWPSSSASIGGFRFNAQVQAAELARRLGVPVERPELEPSEVVPFLLREATESPALWRQLSHLARIVSLDPAEGIRDEGVLPLAPFVDSSGPPAVAIAVELDGEQNLQPCAYVRGPKGVTEHVLFPGELHDFTSEAHRAALAGAVEPVLPAGVAV
jgi:thioredoxin reductase